ncbi:DUF1214 domain-containing protein [Halieaceae bacterium IMCC14734]|uniref:DUF1214 domain-containing protein n=1 Tax=Candidatus Litorirhabdus singularis TaxID=2518993 RepID=A0ABT3TD08_9GAMM|nr:DUF1214 domain-containing protein [Candidatus Litorirhabdus singularis]MCX2979666.1 DUF1214 domain-containing protein [Candidatus Litorirhabdus singularis]
MYGDNPNDPQLKASWDDFCDQLKEAGGLVFRDTTPVHDIDRAKGLRLLARNVSLALQFHLDNNDPDFPELMHYFDPVRKQGGDNTDALYVGAPINGEHTYRITGQRGTARFFAVTVLEDGATPWGGAVIGNLIDKDIVVDADGSFEIVLSPDEHPGNWIQTRPGAWRVTFRQFFADWENEQPMDARIDRLNPLQHDPVLTPARLQQGLRDAAAWVRESTWYWADMLDKWKAQPNHFLSYRQLDDNAIDATPGGEPLICYWQLPVDEVLVVRVIPPAADYWAVEFGNYWWETMDYRYRLCSTNCHHAQLEDNGELLLVVSHTDPGHPNWLDPSGHVEGYITVRWMGAEHYPAPEVAQMPATELAGFLPAGARSINAEQRRLQLEGRRLGILRRFGH